MAAKQWAECSELKPTKIEFGGEFFGGDETADIRAPIRNSAQAGVNADRDVVLECLSLGIYIAGPQERCITLHARISIAM